MYTKNGPQSDDRKAGLQAMGGVPLSEPTIGSYARQQRMPS
jgi:hypothetical protein